MALDPELLIFAALDLVQAGILFVMITTSFANYQRRPSSNLVLFALAFLLLFFKEILQLLVSTYLALDAVLEVGPIVRVANNILEVVAVLLVLYAIVAPLLAIHKKKLATALWGIGILSVALGVYRAMTSASFEVMRVFQPSWFTFLAEGTMIAGLAVVCFVSFSTWRKTRIPMVMSFTVAMLSWLLAELIVTYNALFGGGLLGKITLTSQVFKTITYLLLAYYVASTLRQPEFIKRELSLARMAKFLSYLVAAGFIGFIVFSGATLPTALKASPLGSDTLATQEVVRIEAYVNFAKEELFKGQARIRLVLELLPLGQYDNVDSELHELDLRVYSAESYLGLAKDAGANPSKTEELETGAQYYSQYSRTLKALSSGLREERALEESLVAASSLDERRDYAGQIRERLGELKANALAFKNYVGNFAERHPDYAQDRAVFLDVNATSRGMNALYSAFEDAERQVIALQGDAERLRAITRAGILNLSSVSLGTASSQASTQSIEDVMRKKAGSAAASEAIRTLAGSLVGKCSPADDACRINAVYQYASTQVKYVKDPVSFDYVAEATETILTRAGDCEDKSILLAGLLTVIGEQPKLVILTRPDTGRGHVFVTIRVSDLNEYKALAPKGAEIYYLPKDENYWMAMETTVPNAYIGYEDQAVIDQCNSYKCKEVSLG